MRRPFYFIVFFFVYILIFNKKLAAQNEADKIKTVYPTESNELLLNPGIGFTTFQRFNGDDLNEGIDWTEGFPIEYQEFDGDLTNPNHPQTTLAYFRVNWRFLETAPKEYNWEMIDKALKTAAERGQTLILRISPYEGKEEKDVPVWYRKVIGEEGESRSPKWKVNPENPEYLEYFGGMIATMGQRYDGHPDLEAVDVSFIGYWGEGDGTHLLEHKTRLALINTYLDNFKSTHLIFQPLNGDAPDPGVLVNNTNIAAYWPDGRNNGTGPHMRHLGWRIDCLGDMDFWEGWSHMRDVYPQDILKSGMSEAWKKAPICMEICGTFLRWMEIQKYDEKTVKYIFDQALKWHVSSFNAKSSAVPQEWSPLVNEWLKKMGYRFVIRKFAFPTEVKQQGQFSITSWWENKGVAPIYKDYIFSIRLKSENMIEILDTSANIRAWLPGDIVFDEKLYIPYDLAEGDYEVEIAIVDPVAHVPRVKLAIEGVNKDGWYPMGKIKVKN
jgi:hypothetical protein